MLLTAIVIAAAALLPAAAPEPISAETGVLPAIEVVGRRGFDPETGAGSSVFVPASRGRMIGAGELLAHEAGVTIRSSGGFYSNLSIRGSASSQVQLFLNGVPLPSSLSSQITPALFPMEALERIDIYRGNLPMRFARSPLGGAVDIITLDPASPVAGLRFAMGSFRKREATAFAAQKAGNTHLLFGGAFRTNTGNFPYLNNNGTFANRNDDIEVLRRNNDTSGADGFALWDSALNKHTVRGYALATGANQGMAGFGFSPVKATRLDSRLYASGIELGRAYEQFEWSADIFGGHLRDRFRDPHGEIAAAGRNILNLSDQFGARLHASRNIGTWRPEASVEMETLRFRAQSNERALPTFRKQRAALAAGAAFLHGPLTLRGGAQGAFDQTTADKQLVLGTSLGKGQARRWLPAFSLGAAYRLTPSLTALGNAGTGYRTPSAQEQFGDRGFQIGNPRLQPERGEFVEAGAQWLRSTRHASWQIDGRFFRQEIRDLIGVYQSTPKTASAINFESALSTGYEFQAQARWRFLKAGANFVYNAVLNTGTIKSYAGKQLPGRPLWETGADLAFAMRYLEPFYQINAQGDYFLDPVNTRARRIASRFYHTLGAALIPIKTLRFTGAVENATDVRSFDYIGYPLPGRAYSLVLQLTTPG